MANISVAAGMKPGATGSILTGLTCRRDLIIFVSKVGANLENRKVPGAKPLCCGAEHDPMVTFP